MTLAWHFTADKLRDGRPLPTKGRWLRHVGPPLALCESGLHASERLLDAMNYAPSDVRWLHRVELTGEIVRGSDKLCATRRRIVESYPLNLRRVARLACESAALAAWCAGGWSSSLIAAAEATDRGDWAAAASYAHAAARAADAAGATYYAAAAGVSAANAARAAGAAAAAYATYAASYAAAAAADAVAAAHAAADATDAAADAAHAAAHAAVRGYAASAVRNALEARAVSLLTGGPS